MSINLSGALPKDERDGTGAISAALVEEPEATHVLVCDPEPPALTSAKDRYGDVWTRYSERHLWKGRIDGIGYSWGDIPADCFPLTEVVSGAPSEGGGADV